MVLLKPSVLWLQMHVNKAQILSPGLELNIMDKDMEDVSSDVMWHKILAEDLEETYINVNPSTYFTELDEYDGRRKELDEKLKVQKENINDHFLKMTTIELLILHWYYSAR